MIKVDMLITRRSGMTREDFRHYWQHTHGPIAAKMPGLRRYIQNHVVPDPSQGEPAYDGVVEVWFDSPEAMQAAFSSPEGQATFADIPNFLNPDAMRVLAVEEVTIV